ncbi:ribonuclease P protein component [Geodermatophilus normandii]|uniref:Ribonuclease P protein component n=2 Tax=Geodermatophilus normandii TaxID=1137989 RepID=A0A317QGS4_9ACTN|nr:ribonuclease P protein component [Geodermatophilus normandii]
MVLHLLPVRPPARMAGGLGVPADGVAGGPATGPRAGFVVGKAVGNSVVRHRVTRRLRAVVRDELDRLPDTADLVVRARPEAATATSEQLRRDLSAGLDRVLGERSASRRSRS